MRLEINKNELNGCKDELQLYVFSFTLYDIKLKRQNH